MGLWGDVIMPGLKQLEKFNSDILSLGNEAEVRSQRGEDVILPPIPSSVKDEDDSNDFVDGMPLKKDEFTSDSDASSDDANAVVDIPDLNSIEETADGDDMPDLSLFDDDSASGEMSAEENAALTENDESENADMSFDSLLDDFESLLDGSDENDSNSLSNNTPIDDDLLQSDSVDAVLSNNDDTVNEMPNGDETETVDELPDLDAPSTLDETESADDMFGDMFAGDNAGDNAIAKDASGEGDNFAEDEDFSLPDISDEGSADSTAHFDDLNDLSLPDDLDGLDDLSVSEDSNSASEDLKDSNDVDDLHFLDSSDDVSDIESLDSLDETDSENYVQPGESFSLDDLASFVGETGGVSNGEDEILDDVPQSEAEDSVDSSSDEKPANVMDDDLGFEIEDYSVPENSSATTTGEGVLSGGDATETPSATEKEQTKTIDDDLGFEIEDYSAPENSPIMTTGEGVLSSGDETENSSAPEKEQTKPIDDDLGFEIEDYNAPEDSPLPENVMSGVSFSEEAKPRASSESSGNNSLDDLDLDIEDYSAPSTSSFSNADDSNLSNLDENDGQNENFGDDLSQSDNLGKTDLGLDEGIPDEPFDTSAMDDLEFPSTDEQLSEDGFELSGDSDIMNDDEFEIPGFSDVATVEEKKKAKNSRQKEDEDDDLGLPPNTLSDEQYKKFLDNLATYPLNVRIALEQLIVEDEFTDETEFALIKKVIKKIPARQLASELEKVLDIAIPVPRDFERRTTEEYEAYKSSLQYQIKNRIVPAAVLGVVATGLFVLFFLFGKYFIYEPARASSLYRQGYELLENDDYPQSEIKFNEAVKYDAQKNWFFRYARAYRDKKQYIRAEQMYKAILTFFKHDKQAGLEYARMELEDLANYEKAENVLLRDCLDYHINDADCLLLLGDTYLEWATEKDPQKFEDARARYSELIQLYGETDLYMSRMLRYFIRTDNLLKVLELKARFMPKKKKNALGSEDWTALSGFLFDKLYGYLKPSEEYLRNKIEDVKETLVRAYTADPQNPIALYNFSRYYMAMNNSDAAQAWLKTTIDAFSNAPSLKKRDMYKYINSYKFLGEQLMEQRDYLKARESYTFGISLFNSEKERSNLLGTKEIGELYADMADIDYFISGDMEAAKANYEMSINNFNDNGKIRYKIGNIQYGRKNYSEALGSFMKAAEEYPDDTSLLIAMGNTLSMRDDIYATIGYYEHLKNILDLERAKKGMLFPQTDAREAEIVDTYMRASNNLGVSLYKLSRLTGNSSLNAQAIVNFQESLRAWDALTRNQQTLVRLGGSNLAEQNIRYLLQSIPQFEPAIYTDIPNTLTAEEGIVP